jgi:hypothetical protein
MSRINGDKARSNRQKHQGNVQRMKDRAARAKLTQKSPRTKSAGRGETSR